MQKTVYRMANQEHKEENALNEKHIGRGLCGNLCWSNHRCNDHNNIIPRESWGGGTVVGQSIDGMILIKYTPADVFGGTCAGPSMDVMSSPSGAGRS